MIDFSLCRPPQRPECSHVGSIVVACTYEGKYMFFRLVTDSWKHDCKLLMVLCLLDYFPQAFP